jgi:CxxC-x17-CxxC domain-containing protein
MLHRRGPRLNFLSFREHCIYTRVKYWIGRNKGKARTLTVIVDDAGSGDLLYGVVIGAYREETGEFKYDLIDVHFYQEIFREKGYLQESSRIVSKLVAGFNLKPEEDVHICQGCIFDVAAEELRKVYGEERVKRVRVVGETQRLVEIAYLDEIRNLGYEPLAEREEKRGKSFFHMMRWLKDNPEMLRFAKTGWPRLKNYHLFEQFHEEPVYVAVCSDCGVECEVPFQPRGDRPVYCRKCWPAHRPQKKKTQKSRV